MAGEPEAASATDQTSEVAAGIPQVVLVVTPVEAPSEAVSEAEAEATDITQAAPEGDAAESESAEAAEAEVVEAARKAAAKAETRKEARPNVERKTEPLGTGVAGLEADDLPTEKFQKLPKRAWTAEDDVLTAAVIPVDARNDPGPLSDFLGRTLLFRAARAAATAGVPQLILTGRWSDPSVRGRLEREAQAGFDGPVTLLEGDLGPEQLGERGRVLVLDGSALHDPDSVKRLGQVRGAKTSLLLGRYGDGLCVRTQEGRVTEMGRGMEEPDGVVAGACSAPVEHYQVLANVGERAALEVLGSDDELVATVAPRSYGQQLHEPRSLRGAQHDFFDRLASRGTEGPIDLLLGSMLSRPLTETFLQRRISAATVSAVAGFLAVLGAVILALAPAPLGAILAGLILIVSAVFDRVDGELARLRLDDDDRWLDFGLDHLAHMLVFLALGFSVHRGGDLARLLDGNPDLAAQLGPLGGNAIFLGFAAAAGVLLLGGVLWFRGPPSREPTSSIFARAGDFLATTFSSRDYFYLLLLMAVVNMLPILPPSSALMGVFLIATTALFHALWLGILALTLISPPRN